MCNKNGYRGIYKCMTDDNNDTKYSRTNNMTTPEYVAFKIKWLEKPEYKCLSQIQNKFKAASCNVCIKDINNISNIGGRVDLSHI